VGGRSRLGIDHIVAAALVAAVTVEIPVHDFVRLQQLRDEEIRGRFDLEASCQPTVTAVRGLGTNVIVIVTCRADEPEASPDGAH
jgi:hypothetical protein